MFGVKGVSRITTDAQSFSGKTTLPLGVGAGNFINEALIYFLGIFPMPPPLFRDKNVNFGQI